MNSFVNWGSLAFLTDPGIPSVDTRRSVAIWKLVSQCVGSLISRKALTGGGPRSTNAFPSLFSTRFLFSSWNCDGNLETIRHYLPSIPKSAEIREDARILEHIDHLPESIVHRHFHRLVQSSYHNEVILIFRKPPLKRSVTQHHFFSLYSVLSFQS